MKQSYNHLETVRRENDCSKIEIISKITQLKDLIDKLYLEKKDLIEKSQKSYKNEERDKAKYLSDKAKEYQNRIENLELYFNDLIFYSNNIDLINESLRIIDVRGLHMDESIKRIEKRKNNLNKNGDLCVIVGKSNKSIKNELNISNLGIKIIEYLQDVEKCKFEINQPTIGRILIHYSNNKYKNDKEEENNRIKSLIINSELIIHKIEFSSSICMNDKEMIEILKEKESIIKKAKCQREEAIKKQSRIDEIKKIDGIKNNKKDYKEEENKLINEISELNKQASLNYFRGYNLLNMKRNEKNIIDLHGQYVNEALKILEEKLSELKSEKELKVIYGSGIHSVDHIQKIKPKILELLDLNHYKYKEIDDASLVIYLNKE